eukprot:m.136237 g.136237  ORF g.136237 m.136237 type:complete len:155 (+) comp10535_c0_seq1:99-563(+)
MAPLINASTPWTFLVVASIVDWLVGIWWHGSLFQKPWISGMRKDKNNQKWPEGVPINMTLCVATSTFSSIAQAFLSAHIVPHLLYGIRGAEKIENDYVSALLATSILVLGYTVMPTMENAVWSDRPASVLAINLSKTFVRFSISTILAVYFGVF